MRAATRVVVVLLLVPVLTAAARPAPVGEVLDEPFPAQAVAPGVVHREFSTTVPAGRVRGDVVEVDLSAPGARAGLLEGAVAARSPVASMADGAGAVAGINGDFFDLGDSFAPVRPAGQGGRPIKAAVPPGRRSVPWCRAPTPATCSPSAPTASAASTG